MSARGTDPVAEAFRLVMSARERPPELLQCPQCHRHQLRWEFSKSPVRAAYFLSLHCAPECIDVHVQLAQPAQWWRDV